MTNATKGNPWVLDEAAVATTSPMFVKRMVWTPTTDGHDLDITDNAGNTLWALKAIAADSNQGIEYERVFEGSVNGINIVTIDSGTVYVYQ